MDIKVYPGKLKGVVKAPPSKSMAHRALICAALADGVSVIRGISGSEDMEATIGCMSALGASVTSLPCGRDVEIVGLGKSAGQEKRTEQNDDTGEKTQLDCIESGSTLRFVLPIAAALGAGCSFTGRGKLPQRPMTPLADEMKKKGVTFLPDGRDNLPFEIEGQLKPGVYEIPGNISSQYISGLIFALPLLAEDSEIHIIGSLESAGYIELTLQMIKEFGIQVTKTDYGFAIPGGQTYKATDIEVEGDYSNAAFWMVAAECGSELEITGLRPDSAQGDKMAERILAEKQTDVDSRNIPDIVPVLSVGAVKAAQTVRFYDAGRLRIKESDRLSAMADCLTKLGANVEEKREELIVHPSDLKGGCEVSGYNDHRVVMSMAIAALMCREPVIIRGAEAVAKSYPDFFEEFRRLGGRADVITDRK